MTEVLARVADLRVQFGGQTAPAVDGVSLEVRSGECVALVGESGSGKSLTARALLGLLPASAAVRSTALEVRRVDGRLAAAPAQGHRDWADVRGRSIGWVPQDALGGLDPLRRIEAEVGDALRLHRLASGSARRSRVLAALVDAGVPDPGHRMRQRAEELSGGLRQRALVAAALIAEPELIVADEPTTALDAEHRGRLLEALRRRLRGGAGVLLVSHDLTSVRDIADRVLVMREGRIIESGSPAEVLVAPQQAFTRILIAASPAGVPRGVRLLSHAEPGDPLPPTAPTPTPRTAVTSAAPRLELSTISVRFGQRTVLHEVALQLFPGETVGLIGPSGVGKSTLLRVALGLQAASSGSVRIDGVDRGTAPGRLRRQLRRRLAFVPQDPLASFPHGATGEAILRDALRAARVPRDQRTARLRELAAEVGLDPLLLQQSAATLSGGQRQRLALARALAGTPAAILFDEPVSALDVTVQARVLDLLDDLQARHGTAYLLVSHDAAVIAHMSDRVLRLQDGQISPG